VDITKSIGYSHYGKTYCIAPILQQNVEQGVRTQVNPNSAAALQAAQSGAAGQALQSGLGSGAEQGGITNGPEVQYWAVGYDCCTVFAGSFTCDDSTDGEVHAGAVVFNTTKNSHGYFGYSNHDIYRLAQRKAEANFALHSSDNAMFIRWMKDPSALETWYLEQCRLFLF